MTAATVEKQRRARARGRTAPRYRVRIVIPIEVHGDSGERAALTAWLVDVLKRNRVDADVSHRSDTGIVVLMYHAAGGTGIAPVGAFTAAANCATLVEQALDRELARYGKAPELRRVLSVGYADVKARKVAGA